MARWITVLSAHEVDQLRKTVARLDAVSPEVSVQAVLLPSFSLVDHRVRFVSRMIDALRAAIDTTPRLREAMRRTRRWQLLSLPLAVRTWLIPQPFIDAKESRRPVKHDWPRSQRGDPSHVARVS